MISFLLVLLGFAFEPTVSKAQAPQLSQRVVCGDAKHKSYVGVLHNSYKLEEVFKYPNQVVYGKVVDAVKSACINGVEYDSIAVDITEGFSTFDQVVPKLKVAHFLCDNCWTVGDYVGMEVIFVLTPSLTASRPGFYTLFDQGHSKYWRRVDNGVFVSSHSSADEGWPTRLLLNGRPDPKAIAEMVRKK